MKKKATPVNFDVQNITYSRPDFLSLNSAEEQDQTSEMRDRNIYAGVKLTIPNCAYAECINSGKSLHNEDQAQIGVIMRDAVNFKEIITSVGPNDEMSEIRKQFSTTFGQSSSEIRASGYYFSIFDGHGGWATSLIARNELHRIIQANLNAVNKYQNDKREDVQRRRERLQNFRQIQLASSTSKSGSYQSRSEDSTSTATPVAAAINVSSCDGGGDATPTSNLAMVVTPPTAASATGKNDASLSGADANEDSALPISAAAGGPVIISPVIETASGANSPAVAHRVPPANMTSAGTSWINPANGGGVIPIAASSQQSATPGVSSPMPPYLNNETSNNEEINLIVGVLEQSFVEFDCRLEKLLNWFNEKSPSRTHSNSTSNTTTNTFHFNNNNNNNNNLHHRKKTPSGSNLLNNSEGGSAHPPPSFPQNSGSVTAHFFRPKQQQHSRSSSPAGKHYAKSSGMDEQTQVNREQYVIIDYVGERDAETGATEIGKSGSTGMVAMVYENHLFVANAGDSRAVLVRLTRCPITTTSSSISHCASSSSSTAAAAITTANTQSSSLSGAPPETPKASESVSNYQWRVSGLREMSEDFSPNRDRKRIYKLAEMQPDLLGNDFCPLQFNRTLRRNNLDEDVLFRHSYMDGWAIKKVTEDDLKPPLISNQCTKSRLMCTIAVSRGFGDFLLRPFNEPNIRHINLKSFLTPHPETRIHCITDANSWTPHQIAFSSSPSIIGLTPAHLLNQSCPPVSSSSVSISIHPQTNSKSSNENQADLPNQHSSSDSQSQVRNESGGAEEQKHAGGEQDMRDEVVEEQEENEDEQVSKTRVMLEFVDHLEREVWALDQVDSGPEVAQDTHTEMHTEMNAELNTGTANTSTETANNAAWSLLVGGAADTTHQEHRQILVMATDGFWDICTNMQCALFVEAWLNRFSSWWWRNTSGSGSSTRSHLTNENILRQLCRDLCLWARGDKDLHCRWMNAKYQQTSHDDISIFVVLLDPLAAHNAHSTHNATDVHVQ